MTLFRIFLLLSIISALVATAPPGKAAIWTLGDSSSQGIQYVSKSMNPTDIGNHFLQHAEGHEVLAFLSSHNPKIFSNPTIRESIQSSSRAVVHPYVYHESPTPLSESIRNSQVLQNSQQMSLSQFQDMIKNRMHPIMSNGALDKVEIVLTGHESEVREMKSIQQLCQEMKTPVSFVAVEDAHPQSAVPELGDYSRVLSVPGISSLTTDGIYYKPEGAEYSIYYADTYLYITPDIFTGLLTFLFLTFVALTGLSCLNSIQGPYHFVHKPIPVGKEH